MGARNRRRDQALRMIAAELAGKHPEWSPRRCHREAELAIRLQDANPHFADELLRVAPQLYLPHRSTVAPEVEARVWVEHPAMQWVIGVVCGDAPGRPADRGTPFAGMQHMVANGRPELQLSLRTIAQSAGQAWAYRAPVPRAATSAAYSTVNAMVCRHRPGICVHANLAMVLELAALTTPKGRPMFTDPLRYVAVDGTLIPANVPQRAPKGRSPRERKAQERRIAGPDRPMAQYVVYERGKTVSDAATDDGIPVARPGISRACFGYKLVVLSSIALQVPLVWTLIPATGDERAALRALIRSLYALIPKFPMQYLVGDGLYGMDASLIEWLDRYYGVTGVFPLHAGIRKDLSYSETLGVPKCRHGWARHVGVRDEWDPARRWEEGLAPGVRSPGAPSHRWTCRAGKGCSEIKGTTAREDWRLFSPLPHAGDSRRAARRQALACYRNIKESGFAAMKHRGPGSDWPSRLRIGGDDMAIWVLSLAALRATSARLGHASGAYDQLLARAIDLGLIMMQGVHPTPASTIHPRTADQHHKLAHDLTAPLDAYPPETSLIQTTLPIDEPYRLPKLTDFSAIPDRPAQHQAGKGPKHESDRRKGRP